MQPQEYENCRSSGGSHVSEGGGMLTLRTPPALSGVNITPILVARAAPAMRTRAVE